LEQPDDVPATTGIGLAAMLLVLGAGRAYFLRREARN
jgi:hypothetical protein